DGATCFEARLDAPPARFFTAAWDGGDRRLLVALPRKSAEIRVYDAAQPDAPPRTLDAGGEIRNVALAGRAGRRPPDVAVLLQSGALRIFATDGALRWERTAPDARYAGVRAVDLDADGVAEIMAWVDAGGALDVFDAGGTAVARVAPPPRFRGGEHQAGDFDGDRRREIVFLKEEAPKGGPKRTHVALFAAPFGAPLWQRTFDGGGRRTTTGDVDADGAADLALLFDDGRLVALGGDGVLRWTTSAPVPCETLRGVDLDRDGATELLTQHPGGVLRLWAPPPRDARAANRRRFEQALAAAERGDERAAEAGFLAAGTTWTTLDAFRLESLTDRLARAAETSAAARRALAALEARGR
ncbi:MAG TPA: hypothetical protein VEI02_08225, partial [Planctomycetota bacterium]|nr:hypothetical protein [Planctomycetota bacterium]